MPIRRAAAAAAAAATAAPPSQEKASPAAAEKEPEASPEVSPPADDEPAASSAAPAEPAEPNETAEPTENGEATETSAETKEAEEGAEKKEQSDKCKDCAAGQCATHCYVLLLRLKDGYKYEKTKVKKVKRTIPAWASVAANKKLPANKHSGAHHKMDSIVMEALESGDDSGLSYLAVLRFIVKKYPDLEPQKRTFLLQKSLKRQLQKGTVKQLSGKGFMGTFAIGKKPTVSKKPETLGDALPLIITRLCEPKEASYNVIKKYLKQHFPSFNLEKRPDMLKSALVKAVENGQLEQITGKGAVGTFQLKRTGNKVLLQGRGLEDAIAVAITAMNEPKTCSITTLRRYLVDSNKGRTENYISAYLKRALTKCKVMGWMQQISGHGFIGTYKLSFPYYPSPTTLDPEKFKHLQNKTPSQSGTPKQKGRADSSDEEEEEEDDEEESEDEAPSRRRRAPKRPQPRARHPPATKKSRVTSQARGRGRPQSKKTAAKRGASSATTTPKKEVQKKEKPAPAKSTPVKKGSPAKKPKTPAVKKLTKKGSKRPTQSSPKEAEDTKESSRAGSKRRSKPETASEKGPAAKKNAGKSGSKKPEPEEASPKEGPVKKGAKSNKQAPRKAKRGRK